MLNSSEILGLPSFGYAFCGLNEDFGVWSMVLFVVSNIFRM
jgi:hypothetical protein